MYIHIYHVVGSGQFWMLMESSRVMMSREGEGGWMQYIFWHYGGVSMWTERLDQITMSPPFFVFLCYYAGVKVPREAINSTGVTVHPFGKQLRASTKRLLPRTKNTFPDFPTISACLCRVSRTFIVQEERTSRAAKRNAGIAGADGIRHEKIAQPCFVLNE